mgnify:CR=1 FL=1
MGRELFLRGVGFRRHKRLPVSYKGQTLECGFRLDLLVEGMVVVEVKALEKVLPLHKAQLLSTSTSFATVSAGS